MYMAPFGCVMAQGLELDLPPEARTNVGQLLEFKVGIRNLGRQSFASTDSLIFSATGLPDDAQFEAASGRFSWIPDYTQENKAVLLTFSLLRNGTPVAERVVQVFVLRTVYEPELLIPRTLYVRAARRNRFSLSIADRGRRPVKTELIIAGPAALGARIVGDSLEIHPTLDQNSKAYDIELRADNGLKSTSRTIRISVENTQFRPYFVLNNLSLQIKEGETKSLLCKAFDPNGDDITYSIANASTLPGLAVIDPRGMLSYTAPSGLTNDTTEAEIIVAAKDPYNDPEFTAIKATVVRSISVATQKNRIREYQAQQDSLQLLLNYAERVYERYKLRVVHQRRTRRLVSYSLLPVGAATGFTALITNLDSRTLVAGLLTGVATVATGILSINNLNKEDADLADMARICTNVNNFLNELSVKAGSKIAAISVTSRFDDVRDGMIVFRLNEAYRFCMLVENNPLVRRFVKDMPDPVTSWAFKCHKTQSTSNRMAKHKKN